MKTKHFFSLILGLAILVITAYVTVRHFGVTTRTENNSLQRTTDTNLPVAVIVSERANPPATNQLALKLKSRWADLSVTEQAEFKAKFAAKYRPALLKWSAAFTGRVPFSAEAVTLDQFVERIGRSAAYHEYIFVVDGITLGIQDSKGVARVDYLNAPNETRKLTVMPTGGAVPISITPVSKDEMVKTLFAEGGNQFSPNEIRLIPSGYSGSLNGGAFVNVGGDPNNAASWKYDMIFDADGKQAYYLKGH